MLHLCETGEKGFSMLEVVMAMAIGLIILAAISMTLTAQRKGYRRQYQRVEMIQTARAALDVISREVMMAGYDPLGKLQRTNDAKSNYTGIVYHADQLEIRADLDGDGSIVKDDSADPTDPNAWVYDDGANERIVYKLKGNVLKRKSKAGYFQPFAENIHRFQIRYIDGEGNRNVTNSSEIHQVELVLEVEAKGRAGWGGPEIERLATVVEMRNMGLEKARY
ncbi:MAG: prepilin-type N-terminal cleavage/methylation domain-containing protein [Desulfobacterales bacterium]